MRELQKRIFPKKLANRSRQEKEIITLSQMFYYLKRRKFIRIQRTAGKVIINLTEKGKKRKLSYDLEEIKVPQPSVWDGKWRLVIFDIPEKYRDGRSALRNKLIQMGFLQFQKSVWVYPFPCENEIDFVCEYFSLARYVNLLVASIDNDKHLRQCFSV